MGQPAPLTTANFFCHIYSCEHSHRKTYRHFISPDLDSEISRHIKPGSFRRRSLTSILTVLAFLPCGDWALPSVMADVHLWDFFKIHCATCVHVRDPSPACRPRPECVGKTEQYFFSSRRQSGSPDKLSQAQIRFPASVARYDVSMGPEMCTKHHWL